MTIKPTPQHILNLLAKRAATLPEIAKHAAVSHNQAMHELNKLIQSGSVRKLFGQYALMPKREAAAVKYEPLQLHDMPPLRPGALDYLKHPSRRGNRLFYADGRVEVMAWSVEHCRHMAGMHIASANALIGKPD